MPGPATLSLAQRAALRMTGVAASAALLVGCATSAPPSGALATYEGLQPKTNAVRAKVAGRQDPAALEGVRKVRIAPTGFAPGAAADWMTAPEREMLLRELDAQLCFELSERYEIAAQDAAGAHDVRAWVARVGPTGRVGSAASAAASFFIPGPIGVRSPDGLGELAVEAEMLEPGGRQLAAITWSRRATAVGADNPSLSRVGDALQFAEPFADAAAAEMSLRKAERRRNDPDPCARFGPRFRPEGWLAKFATGLYVPQMSGAKADRPN